MFNVRFSQLAESQIHPQVVKWINYINTNSGARPSVKTILAVNRFWKKIVTCGLSSKIKLINPMVPDSLIACMCPLYFKGGPSMWTAVNFSASDLTVNGLKGNKAGAKYITLAANPSLFFTTFSSVGATLYCSENSDVLENDFGVYDLDNSTSLILNLKNSGGTYLEFLANDNDSAVGSVASAFKGYYSGNRTSLSASYLYAANSSTAHSKVGENTSETITDNIPGYFMDLFTISVNGSPDTDNYSAKRLSFFALHDGLTEAESALFYNLIQSFRQQIGGGYV